MSIPLASIEMLQTMRDDKDLRQTEHPMDRLTMLLTIAQRDNNVQQIHLVATLLNIIDGLHERICELETKALPPRRQINNPEDEDSE
jgi:hypothetical protein